MSKVKIVDNFLSEKQLGDFIRFVKDPYFPWFRGYKVADVKNSQIQMRHLFLKDNNQSMHFEGVKPILDFFDKKIEKVKINLTFNSGEQTIGGWHYDYLNDDKIKIAILYLNTNNGYTMLKDGTKIKSVENRLALFDNVWHTDVTQTDTEERVVLNIGYYE